MNRSFYFLATALLGFVLIYIAPLSPNYTVYDIFGGLVFWSSIGLFLAYSVLQKVFRFFKTNLNKVSITIFVSYISVHYLVYSIALERLLTAFYGQLFFVSSPFISFSVTTFYPSSLYTALMNLFFNPDLVAGLPPDYYVELSFYAMFMGLIISTLVTVTITRVINMARTLGGLRTILLAPIIGVIGGGSCCVSIPIILATAVPAANFLVLTAPGEEALFLTYILLPPITALALGIHFRSLIPKPPKEFRLTIKNKS
ncbi:hypothetical protein [Acidianus sp. RZ1]|uniref:hypothetical protein n=1 Tax=Acidianus sp. RZ1 TaxID=1540082 RepID=UPI00149133CB|nr:hypothetical protein [Acidianus sp. RZ1]NON62651.1 hypothetical protein [Acidianus sp. RZ1]